MMKQTIKGLSLLAACFGTTLVFAGTIEKYSADIVDVNGGYVFGKAYVTPTKMRSEFYSRDGTLRTVSIFRMDLEKMYLLFVERKTYFEFPVKGKTLLELEEEIGALMMGEFAPHIEREKMGEEIINGYYAEKYRVSTSMDIMGKRQTAVTYQWTAEEFDIPVRTEEGEEGKQGRVKELRNLKVGAPKASLFELPAGYTLDEDEIMRVAAGVHGGKK